LQQDIAKKENSRRLAFHFVVHEQVAHQVRDFRIQRERDIGAIHVRDCVHHQRDRNDAQPALLGHRFGVQDFPASASEVELKIRQRDSNFVCAGVFHNQHLSASFPLTPALSRVERGKRSQFLGKTMAVNSSMACEFYKIIQ